MAKSNRTRARRKAVFVQPKLTHIKLFLCARIATIIEEQQLTQADAARRMRTAQSQVCLVVGKRIKGLSVERLLTYLAGLGDNIILRTVPNGKRGTVRAWTDA
jgi:predicted XRE-type DNA-binding protein